MDIFVSHLNHRMALQLPAEFPLGLVFVVGRVERFLNRGNNGEGVSFYLSEGNHRIRCRLSRRHTDGVVFTEGVLIRAGGHLAFDTGQADYYLLARDVEILEGYRPSRTSLSEIIADAQKRSQAEIVPPEQMPEWVQRIAPPELQADWQRETSRYEDQEVEDSITQPELLATTRGDLSYPSHEPALAQLSDELIEFLSEAMDSDDEVEVTAELLGTVDVTGRSIRREVNESGQQQMLTSQRLEEKAEGMISPAPDQDAGSTGGAAATATSNGKVGEDTVPWYFVVAVLILFAGFSAIILYTLLNQLT